MRIGIDIDDTLTNIKKDLLKSAEKYALSLGKKIDYTTEVIERGNNGNIYQQIYGFNYEELKYFLGNIQETITNGALPRRDCAEVIKKLHDEGNEIYIVTARDSEFHDNPYKQSEEWLTNNGIFYDKLIVNARDKGITCLENEIDLLIDDNIDNCLRVKNCGIEAIMVGESRKNEGVLGFNDWNDIYDFISSGRISKIVSYSDRYKKEICDFINASMFNFLGRAYKERADILNVNEYYLENNGGFWLAIDVTSKRIVGSIALDNKGAYGILKRFYVDEEYQHFGVGSRLYKEVFQHLNKKTEIDCIYLACSKRLDNAHKFYLKNGFVKVDKLDDKIEINYSIDDDYFMKKIDR